MPIISRDQAVQKLVHEMATMPLGDLAEVYNELFPSQPATEEQARQNRGSFLGKITDHIERGLEIEEIVDLWNVVFPKDDNVYYDDDTNTIHFNEESESIRFTE